MLIARAPSTVRALLLVALLAGAFLPPAPVSADDRGGVTFDGKIVAPPLVEKGVP